MKVIKTDSPEFAPVRDKLLNRGVTYGKSIESSVKTIIESVRKNGDKALIKYTKKFDSIQLTPSTMRISKDAIKKAYSKVEGSDIKKLEYAAKRINEFHKHQKISGWKYTDNGVLLGQKVTSLERVGVYVPGGKAIYPSSVLMSVIPAKIAGVKQVIICTPTPASFPLSLRERERVRVGFPCEINPHVLIAADIAGADKIYTVGGAQAVAAMALGTDTVPRVDK